MRASRRDDWAKAWVEPPKFLVKLLIYANPLYPPYQGEYLKYCALPLRGTKAVEGYHGAWSA